MTMRTMRTTTALRAGPAPAAHGATLVLASADGAALSTTAPALRRAGFWVAVAADGTEALRRWRAARANGKSELVRSALGVRARCAAALRAAAVGQAPEEIGASITTPRSSYRAAAVLASMSRTGKALPKADGVSSRRTIHCSRYTLAAVPMRSA